ncbi:MAG: hypothetical protein ACI8ZM_003221 [Crocinitomix sp.]|jgi:hypothetical protein
MLKWIFPIMLFTACTGQVLEGDFEDEGVIKEYIASSIIPKSHTDRSKKQVKSICLPEPNKEFIKLKAEKNNSICVYDYLIMHLDSLEERSIKEVDEFWGAIKWEQHFKGGVFYKFTTYIEIGYGGELYTQCRDKAVFLSVLTKVIEIKDDPNPDVWPNNYIWKNDSTLYESKTELEGCHFAIKINEIGYYFLTWTCAC